eukprot:SAG31_NODE_28053_length_416_cov_0.779180_1_plen_43_part_01
MPHGRTARRTRVLCTRGCAAHALSAADGATTGAAARDRTDDNG